MHEIQKHILKTLLSTKKAKFSTLKPKNVEGNIFVYHLKKMIREGYIVSTDEKYSLSPMGVQLVDRVSLKTLEPRIQPKIVTLLCIEKSGKFLLYKRKRTPFIDKIGFPYGKIHLEEKLINSANRELLEKTNLKCNLKYRGHVYITIHDESELVTQMLCHIYYGKNPIGELKTDTQIGECFWQNIEEIKKSDLIPGVLQISKLIKNSKNHFFDEYFLNI